MSDMLKDALSVVDWNKNRDAFLSCPDYVNSLHNSQLIIGMWSREIESFDKGNVALPFVREMQHGAHNVAICLALALYKPAAAAMRSMLECALYYAYFRVHPAELKSLVRDDKFYIAKKDVMQFFQKHVPNFNERQSALVLLDKLERWYSETSAIVHGQIPGGWGSSISLSEIAHNPVLDNDALSHFERCCTIIHEVFLCVLGGEAWSYVATDSKAFFTKGMSPEVRLVLQLDKG